VLFEPHTIKVVASKPFDIVLVVQPAGSAAMRT
jgi:hypothetical protein